MAIPTKPGLVGFVRSDPTLTYTKDNTPRLYARVGIPQSEQDAEGNFHDVEPYDTDLIMFGKSAERAHAQLQRGDNFIAEGRVRTYTQNVDGNQVEREQFRASSIGHNGNITNYTVNREPRTPDAADRETVQHDATDRQTPDAGQPENHSPTTETPAAEAEGPAADADGPEADPVAEVLAARGAEAAFEPDPRGAASPAVHQALSR